MERITIDGKEYGKIPFDLERWQSGDFVKVVTRDNRDVEQLTHFSSIEFKVNLASVISNSIHLHYKNGKFYGGVTDRRDLHLLIELPQPKEIWQNVYRYADKPTIGRIEKEYLTQIEADNSVDYENGRIGYFKTTIIEGEQPKYEFIPINQ